MLKPKVFDERREIVIPGDNRATLVYCVEHFIAAARKAVHAHGAFYVALSGGSTPKAIFELLSSQTYAHQVPWNKVHLFWSDERAVPSDDPQSNYHMAMHAGFKDLPIPKGHIHRMHAEKDIEEGAKGYEDVIGIVLRDRPFDLVMLGMGEDGHTASLFPYTEGLHAQNRLVIANFLPDKKIWRMSLTYDCINQAKQSVIYVLGDSKKEMLAKVLLSTDDFERLPVQKVGTVKNPALWIVDDAAAAELLKSFSF